MRIELFWLLPYALAVAVLPFALFETWRTRHKPKGQAARRALLNQWAAEREAARDDAWRATESATRHDGQNPALATGDGE